MVRSRAKGDSSKTSSPAEGVEMNESSNVGDSSFTRMLGLIALCSALFLGFNFLQQLTTLTVDDGADNMARFEKFLKEEIEKKRKHQAEDGFGFEDDDGAAFKEQKYQGDKHLPWENPFLAHSMKGGNVYVNVDKTEDEILEESLMEQIDEWLRDPSEQSEELKEVEQVLVEKRSSREKLIKKQKFVEDKIREMLSIKNLRTYDYQDLKTLLEIPDTLKPFLNVPTGSDAGNGAGNGNGGGMATNAKYAVLSSATSSMTKQNGNRILEETLKSLGFEPQTDSDKGKGLPMFLISYGSKCYSRQAILKNDQNDHIFFCVSHRTDQINRFYPYATLSDAEAFASKLEQLNPNLKSIPTVVRQVWNSKYFQKVFRLFNSAEREEVIRRSQTSQNPVWVVVPKHGQGTQQLTMHVDQVASKYSEESLGCIAYEYNNAPALWDGKKFLFRTWVILARSNPALAFYGGTHSIRSKVNFEPFDASQVKSTKEQKVAMHFPNTAVNDNAFEVLPLSALKSSFSDLNIKVLEKKIASLATYAVVALHAENRPSVSEENETPKHVHIEHLCMDFSIGNLNDFDSIALESVATDCSLHKGATPKIKTKITSLAATAAVKLLNGQTGDFPKGLPILLNEKNDVIFH
mmetsp:Transcript_34521/g.42547  ORF Transcript_34521/g.42547 Transcript_34521/m.42547 type:complete len:634 (-) Transcript_34521:53-1954(-)